ncbi:MAG TPA: 23S rRNA (guanosine(2251)-2'-O)-methyltransferase RlmB [bacterium]|nr:23S rRNA (guanosine(2251)-2'-O)-methyltransferase RlmB [bacterium]
MSEKIYGRKPVLEALRSGNRAITRIYLLQGSRDGVLNQIEAHAQAKGIAITLETRHRMDTMAGNDKHQGAIAVAEDYKYADLQDLLDIARDKNEPAFILLLDEIEDPQNLGAILRSADAAGIHGVVIPKNRAAEVTATVIKASAGAAEHVQTVKVTNINDTIKKLKEANVWVVGTDIEATKNFYEYDYRQPVALVIGNEGKGLRRLVKENCDELVKIPMAGKMSSLNASVAAALLLFEVTRQRNWKGAAPNSPPTVPRTPTYPITPETVVPTYYAMADSPPERDFFRSGPDPALEATDEGAPSEVIQPLESNEPHDPPGNNKGGGFKW